MNKIIITSDGLSDIEALACVINVVNEGKVSNKNTQYCFVTKFTNGCIVYAEATKSGTNTFKVWKDLI